jgi:hypothetical protein
MRLFYLFFISALVSITFLAAPASAQDVLQGEPPIVPAPRPTHVVQQPSNPEMQLPQQAPQRQYLPPPPPPPMRVPLVAAQPVLPPVFRGCWEGTVENVDSIQRAPGGHKLGYWTPKIYRLCYKRVGDGPYQLTFGETNVVATDKIKYSKGSVEIKQTDGRSYAELRAFLHFDEYHKGFNPSGSTFSVDEVTMLECKIDGDLMHVIADVNGRREDVPWFHAHWRTTFIRVPM